MTSIIKHVNRYAVTKTGLELFANFYYPPKCQDGKPKGLFVAYHGGGVIVGSRDEEFIFEPVKRAVLDNGFILVQPGYRLLVPTTGHEIVQDVETFYDYLMSEAYMANVPEGVKPDLNKILVAGFSGGGYVARLAAIEMIQAAKAGRRSGVTCAGMVSYFGMGGDVLQPDWIKPKKSTEDSFKEIEHLYQSREISDSPYTPGLKGWENKEPRDVVWDWSKNNGLFVDILVGTKGSIRDAWTAADGKIDADQLIPAEHHSVIPQIWFSSKENAKSFPPSFYVHGTADDAVPYAESVSTVDALRKAGNEEVEFVTIEGVDHDLKVPGETECRPEVDEAHGKVVAFILKQLGA